MHMHILAQIQNKVPGNENHMQSTGCQYPQKSLANHYVLIPWGALAKSMNMHPQLAWHAFLKNMDASRWDSSGKVHAPQVCMTHTYHVSPHEIAPHMCMTYLSQLWGRGLLEHGRLKGVRIAEE